MVIFDDLMDSDPIFLTGNTDTVYALGFFDLNKDGPMVVEIPKGSGPGTVNDAFFRFVIDMAEAASYVNVFPEKNDGNTAYTLTAKDVPVDAFWSVTLYEDGGWIPVNKYNAYSFNDVTAKKDKDESITIHFGGDPKADNFLPIVKGWNYIVRLYRPKKEILDGSWTFPSAEAVQ